MSTASGDRPSRLITESGCYRLGDKSWERVPDELAEAIEAAGGGCNLVWVDIGDPVTEEPLW